MACPLDVHGQVSVTIGGIKGGAEGVLAYLNLVFMRGFGAPFVLDGSNTYFCICCRENHSHLLFFQKACYDGPTFLWNSVSVFLLLSSRAVKAALELFCRT